MQAPKLTTTFYELNRLYRYCAAVDKETPPSHEAQRAWIEYETYAKRYMKERRMESGRRTGIRSLQRSILLYPKLKFMPFTTTCGAGVRKT
jgi:hypothetical protein